MQFTHWTIEFDIREHGSLMQRQESLHFHRKRRITLVSLQNMIEQVVTGFGFIGAGLEPNQTNKGVSQKVVSDLPCICTFGTDFKRIHFQVFVNFQKVEIFRLNGQELPKVFLLTKNQGLTPFLPVTYSKPVFGQE